MFRKYCLYFKSSVVMTTNTEVLRHRRVLGAYIVIISIHQAFNIIIPRDITLFVRPTNGAAINIAAVVAFIWKSCKLLPMTSCRQPIMPIGGSAERGGEIPRGSSTGSAN